MSASPAPVLLMAQALTQGGTERQLTETALALDRRRFAPHVAVFRPGGMRYEELAAAAVPVAVFPASSFAHPSIAGAAWKFRRYLRAHGIQLVHAFDVPANVFAVPVARWAGTPVVLASQRAYRELAPPHLRPLVSLSDRLAHGIVANCEAMRQHLREQGIADQRIRVCYNGIDTARFAPGERRRPAELAGASLVIGVVCALRPEKNLPLLVESFARAGAALAGARLVIVGSGPEREGLEALSRQLGVTCLFVPSTAEVPTWLRAIDIFVLPSRSEAFSNAMMEAMACRCAVIASRVGGNVELAGEEERALLFDNGDGEGLTRQLLRLAGEASLRERLAEAGAVYVRDHFSQARAGRRMGEIYSEFLERG